MKTQKKGELGSGLKRLLLSLGAAALTVSAVPTTQAATTADILFVVDESGSMGGEHAWISTMVTALDAQLATAGVTGNQYGLVGFGDAAVSPHKHTVGGGDFGTAAQLSLATGTLVTNGGTEDGWAAINFALSNYTFRSGAALNVILISDEDRDNTTPDTYASTLLALTNKGALLNAVVDASFVDGASLTALGIDSHGNAYKANGVGGFTTAGGGIALSGFGNTIANYVNMALASGGASWDLNQLRVGGLTAQSFTSAFTKIKTQEITVPDTGSTLLLLSATFSGFAMFRRRFA